MIIDKEQLISLLKEKTGLERESVEDQLEELIKRIQKAAAKDKSFEIEGFGTFSMEEDKLQFEPSDTLETEINNKYAGMKPIELIGAFKEPEGDDVPEIDEDMEEPKDKVWAFDKEADEQERAPEELVDEEYKGEAEEQERPPTTEGKAEEAVKRQDKMEKRPSGRPVEESTEEPAKVGSKDKEEKDNIGELLVAAVIIIAIGISGWVVYDTGLISGWDSAESGPKAAQFSAQQKKTDNQEESSATQESSSRSSEESTISEPEQQLGVEKEDTQPKEPSEEEETFGLKGEVNETINDGYTIVVYSLRSKEVAEDRRKNFEESGYRAVISKAEVQGTTYFRVGLGQFPTVDAAQQAVSDLPGSYQSNQDHFIKRFQ